MSRDVASLSVEEARLDRFLWSVRLFTTRTQATEACRGGHIRVNSGPAKPSSRVRVGDVISARVAGRERVLQVARLVDRRVGAPVAAECIIDHSPAPKHSGAGIVREVSAARPTKRDRRQLDRLRGRS